MSNDDDGADLAARCPLCGGDNACGAVAASATCWCFDVKIKAEVLARIPAEAQGTRCICQRCAGIEPPAERFLHLVRRR
jgi:hypothetical protein